MVPDVHDAAEVAGGGPSKHGDDGKSHSLPLRPASHDTPTKIITTPRSGVIARDITQEFTEAASRLPVGVLIKDDFFTLFESVGALEIMDPKLDSGYVEPGESIDDDYDVMRPLSPEETIGVMDQLLCQEMAWHLGSPLSQTLFTSLYLDRLLSTSPKPLEEIQFVGSNPMFPPLLGMLRAYSIALIKCCYFVHGMIGTERCYEEEDFVTNLYNRNLFSTVDEQEIMELLDHEISSMDDKLPQEVKKALINRLQFRKVFLAALASSNESCEAAPSPPWQDCLTLLGRVIDSSKYGIPVPESFSVKLQRKLASTVPPRPMVELKFDKALEHLRRLCQDSHDVMSLRELHGSNNIKTFLSIFQFRKPQPLVYVRTLLQTVVIGDVFSEEEIYRMKQLLFEDLAEIVLPADILLDPRNQEIEAVHDPRFHMAIYMEHFARRVQQTYVDHFRILCQNRSRMRRLLCHSIHEWEAIQNEAEDIDTDLRRYTHEKPILIDNPNNNDDDDGVTNDEKGEMYSYPLSSWAYLFKLRQMEQTVQLGFELDIYQPDELGGMYCTDEFGMTLSYNEFQIMEAIASQEFSYGLSCFYTTLLRLQLINIPSRPFGKNHLRYELRMKPFLGIDLPEMFPYEEFIEMVEQRDKTGVVDDCLKDIEMERGGSEQNRDEDGGGGSGRVGGDNRENRDGDEGSGGGGSGGTTKQKEPKKKKDQELTRDGEKQRRRPKGKEREKYPDPATKRKAETETRKEEEEDEELRKKIQEKVKVEVNPSSATRDLIANNSSTGTGTGTGIGTVGKGEVI
ncbi:MAG: hypothetical protein M1823_002133 [Watsoniomyces obsoletus]|nr:MAG: hypothetical protein M1823_002133 [Watsoniomyces obsoletus]